jgi:diadenosine tetraphosphate (Ap4A) HIT family hydrolase
MTGSGCFVCDKHASGDALGAGVIYEDDLVFSSHGLTADSTNLYLGWVFVEPKRHVAGLGHMKPAEAAAVGMLVSRLAAALQSSEGAEHVYAHVYGDAAPHLHVHLIPRYPNTPREYWPDKLDEWPDAPRGGLPEVQALTHRLAETIAHQGSDI